MVHFNQRQQDDATTAAALAANHQQRFVISPQHQQPYSMFPFALQQPTQLQAVSGHAFPAPAVPLAALPVQPPVPQVAIATPAFQPVPQTTSGGHTGVAPPRNTLIITNANVLPERFKTKMCKNFMRDGVCPYKHRCMFAHGQDELRTTDMNLNDGLVTEEAIRSFQRAMTATNHGGHVSNDVSATDNK